MKRTIKAKLIKLTRKLGPQPCARRVSDLNDESGQNDLNFVVD